MPEAMQNRAGAKTVRVAIVGGGPSGLTTLKTLLEHSDRREGFNVEATLFEAEDAIGGTFRYRGYDNAQLVSSKQLTCFSDFRMPLDAPDHLKLPDYVAYLERYVEHFELRQRSRMLFSTRVVRVRRGEAGQHIVRWREASGKEHEEAFDQLAICSGLHVTPAYPDIPGLPTPQVPLPKEDEQEAHDKEAERRAQRERAFTPEQKAIKTLHSSVYKQPDIFTGKHVLVLGTGETGMDMAYEAVKARAASITLSTRQGFLSFPAVLENFTFLGATFDSPTPIDGLITNLAETAYVHPWVARSHMRWHVSDFIIKRVLWVLTGTMAGCNQWVGELPPERLGRAYTFLNKSARAMPYINREWKDRHWFMERVARYLDPPSVTDDEPGVSLAPFPSRVDADGRVQFVRNGRKEDLRMRERVVKPDVVVFATGYKHDFPFLDASYPRAADATIRDILAPDEPSVAFIGFTRPGVGAIPPQSELSAQLWTLIMAGECPIPTSPPHYHLIVRDPSKARITHGVDYSSYVSQLARDMGAAPGLWELWRQHGALILFIYCFAAAFPTLYRLVGPWAHPDAPRIARTEILETITRRGIMGNLMMGVIPMAFYLWVNGMALLLETALHIAQGVAPGLCAYAARTLHLQPPTAQGKAMLMQQ